MTGIRFEKVPFEEFSRAWKAMDPETEWPEDRIRNIYDCIQLPKRATPGSAGYDIQTPMSFFLNEYHPVRTFPTGIRVIMPEGVTLLIVPRSGSGFKTGVHLANTVGVIDSDYQFADNHGHIMVKLVRGWQDSSYMIGDRVAQAIFVPYLTTEDDLFGTPDASRPIRKGGFGSTGE